MKLDDHTFSCGSITPMLRPFACASRPLMALPKVRALSSSKPSRSATAATQSVSTGALLISIEALDVLEACSCLAGVCSAVSCWPGLVSPAGGSALLVSLGV